MPFPPTPSNTPTNTPTPSITPSNTPTNTPSNTSCPSDITPTITPTNTNTPTNTQTFGLTPTTTPTNTNTPTSTSPSVTPTSTATPTVTPTSSGSCECYRLDNTDEVDISISFFDCGGSTEEPDCISCPVGASIYLCIQAGQGNNYTVSFGTNCSGGPTPSFVLTYLGTSCTTAGDCL